MALLLLQKTDAEMDQKRTFEPDVKAVEDLLEDSWSSKQEENRLEEVKMEPEVAREVTPDLPEKSKGLLHPHDPLPVEEVEMELDAWIGASDDQ